MKNQKILMIIIPILLVISFFIFYIDMINSNTDGLKFKKEYESLNDKMSSSKKKYNKLNIDKNNNIKYSNYNEVIDIIKNKTGIIYLGYPECPWCRSAVPVLLKAVNDYKIDKVYYINMRDERDSYTVEDDKLVYSLDNNGKEVKGTKGYFKLLKELDNELSDYIITVENKTYEVGEKRIYMPSVIFVRDGKIIGIQVSTLTSQTDPYIGLSKDEEKELYSIYEGYITEILDSTCSVGSSC